MQNTMKIMNLDVSNVCVLGDIHSSIHELESVVSQSIALGVDKFISVGDLVDRGEYPNEVIQLVSDLIKDNKLSIFFGNHDWKLIKHFRGQKVNITEEQELTLKLLTSKSVDLYLDMFKENPIAIYDPVKRFFLSHAGGRPHNILFNDYRKSLHSFTTFNEYLFDTKDKFINKKYVDNLMYGTTNGQFNAAGRPIRIPLVIDSNDDLDNWVAIFGHIHANKLFPEGNMRAVCVDYSCSELGGTLCGLIIRNDTSIKEENQIFAK